MATAVYKTAVLPGKLTVVPVGPSGQVSTATADDVLNANNHIPVIAPTVPVMVVPSFEPSRINLIDTDTAFVPQTVVPVPAVPGATATGLMAWAKANPLPAVGVAALIVWGIYELTKLKR